uniref:Uncharacterized protein n=1 Tax=Nymphaea colorata TaxID=210225 RepID=A0A5K1CMZ8_9MAGN
MVQYKVDAIPHNSQFLAAEVYH